MDCVHWMRTPVRARARGWVRAALLLALVAAVPIGCNTADEEASTEITKTVGKVESGYAFDWARSNLHSVKRVIVPDSADVRHDSSGTDMVVYLQKTLDYKGDAATPLSIRTLRSRMGVAARMEQEALILATFGEWDAGNDGGASIKVVVQVPPEVEVTRRTGLTGRSSPANGESALLRSGPPQTADEVTAKGWMPLSESYDPQRRVLN